MKNILVIIMMIMVSTQSIMVYADQVGESESKMRFPEETIYESLITNSGTMQSGGASYMVPEYKMESARIGVENLGLIEDEIHITEMKQMGYSGIDVVIGVVDTGIDNQLDIFENKIVEEKSFVTVENGYSEGEGTTDQNGHGSSVASIILGNNSIYEGISPSSKLVSAKVASRRGVITSKALINAIEWLGNREDVDIITLSLSEVEESVREDPLEEATKQAAVKGKIIVMSAGNSGSSSQTIQYYSMGSPSSSPHVITVGATDGEEIASYSSNGPTMNMEVKPDVVVQGTDIPAYGGLVTGTSFATPIVTGSVAVLLSAIKMNNMEYNPGTIKSIITKEAYDLGHGWMLQGNGRINITASWEAMTRQEIEYSNVFPTKIPMHERYKIPKGETIVAKITAVSESIGEWLVEASSIIDEVRIKQEADTYNTIITLEISPSIQNIGKYNEIIKIKSPMGRNHEVELEIEIVPETAMRVLIDLLHTPWDSYLSGGLRQERIMGKDLTLMIDLMRSKNMWVEEILYGELTGEILAKYDVLWMPSAFAETSPTNYDHGLATDTIINSREIAALHEYMNQGGDVLIDYAGTSSIDNNFGRISVEEESLRSLMAIIGMGVKGQINDNNQKTVTSPINSSSLYSMLEEYNGLSSGITLSQGMKMMGNEDRVGTYGIYGSRGSRVLIQNTRNWRDDETMAIDAGYQEILLDWLVSEDGIKSVIYGDENNRQVITLEVTASVNSITVQSEGKEEEIQLNQVSDGVYNVELIIKKSRVITLRVEYEGGYDNYDVYVDGSDPKTEQPGPINVKYDRIIEKIEADGMIGWVFKMEDDEPIYDYQVKIEMEGELSKYAETYYNKNMTSKNGGVIYLVLDESILDNKVELKSQINKIILLYTISIYQGEGRYGKYQYEIWLDQQVDILINSAGGIQEQDPNGDMDRALIGTTLSIITIAVLHKENVKKIYKKYIMKKENEEDYAEKEK